MDLKDFIQSAVSQIVEGMVAAQAAAATHGATLNPAVGAGGKGNPSAAAQAAAGARVSNIAFDVAVTAVEDAGADGSAKLRVAGAGADLQAKGEQVTRLQFSLPIALPQARCVARDGDGPRFGIPADRRERRQHLVAGALRAAARTQPRSGPLRGIRSLLLSKWCPA